MSWQSGVEKPSWLSQLVTPLGFWTIHQWGISSHTFFVSGSFFVVSLYLGKLQQFLNLNCFGHVGFPYFLPPFGVTLAGKAAIIWRGLYFVYDTKNGQQIPSESAWETVLDFESHEVMLWMVCYDFCGFSSHAIHGEISLSKKDVKKTYPFSAKTTILNMQVFWLTRWRSFYTRC